MRKMIVAAGLILSACQQSPEREVEVIDTNTATVSETVADDGVAACVTRGVAYFKEIGSYPVLHSLPDRGRSAEEVAAERCGRTTTAF